MEFVKSISLLMKKLKFSSSQKRNPTKRAATVLKVKSKTTIKGKTSPSQTVAVCLNGTLSRIIAFKMVRNFRMHAVRATFFTFPLFNNC